MCEPGLVREAEQRIRRLQILAADPYAGGTELADVALLKGLVAEVRRLEASLKKIDEIRNSLIGTQTVNWSAHIYPLVAALAEAGYKGESYDVAREKAETLIEQRNDAISRAEQAESSLSTLHAELDDERSTFSSFVEHHAATELELNSIKSRLSMLVTRVQQLEQQLQVDAEALLSSPNLKPLGIVVQDYKSKLTALRIAATGEIK